jgi:hypothetical protein
MIEEKWSSTPEGETTKKVPKPILKMELSPT